MTKEQFFSSTFVAVQRLQREAWKNKDFNVNVECQNISGKEIVCVYCHVWENGKLSISEHFNFYPWDTEEEISDVLRRLTRFVRAFR